MDFENLNQMILYIENHLTTKIDYSVLCKIVGVSQYNLQRIFLFITGTSLSEYIRKRRLSKSLEELKSTNIKVVNLAVKYQYDSSISFIRAFKKLFGQTPIQCRKDKKNYTIFPMISLVNHSDLCKQIDYQEKYIESFKVYCMGVSSYDDHELCIKISHLYDRIQNNGIWDLFNQYGMYGVSISHDQYTCYYVGSKRKQDHLEEIIIPQGYYYIFQVGSRKQDNILKTEKMIYHQWNHSASTELDENLIFELYTKDNCYLYVPKKE